MEKSEVYDLAKRRMNNLVCEINRFVNVLALQTKSGQSFIFLFTNQEHEKALRVIAELSSLPGSGLSHHDAKTLSQRIRQKFPEISPQYWGQNRISWQGK